MEITKEGSCIIEGTSYPAVGFGTYLLTGNRCEKAVASALECGYRIIDTATFYKNFVPIGNAINAFGRKECYLVSKAWPDSHTPEKLERDLTNTLDELKTDYLDTYLLHWPNSQVSLEPTLEILSSFISRGNVRHIGISNPTVHHLKRALEVGVPIHWVQVEMNPRFYDYELLDFCHSHSIVMQGWAPLSKGKSHNDSTLRQIGKNHNASPSQVSIRWAVQHGCLPLPASSNPKHIKENFNSLNFSLSESEMAQIDANARNGTRTRYSWDEFDFTYEECWPHKGP